MSPSRRGAGRERKVGPTLDGLSSQRWGGEFPLGTLVINLTGTALLGLLTGLALEGTALLLARW